MIRLVTVGQSALDSWTNGVACMVEPPSLSLAGMTGWDWNRLTTVPERTSTYGSLFSSNVVARISVIVIAVRLIPQGIAVVFFVREISSASQSVPRCSWSQSCTASQGRCLHQE